MMEYVFASGDNVRKTYRARAVATSVGLLLALLGSATVASTISDFAIYGTNSVMIGVNSNVFDGKVGSNTQITTNAGSGSTFADEMVSGGGIHLQGNNFVLSNLVASGTVQISDADTDVAGKIDANIINFTNAGGNGIDVHGHATANSYVQAGNGNFLGGMTIGVPTPPDLPVFPLATSFSAGGPNQNNPGNLGPGVYGAVSANTAAGLHLSSGIYKMDSLSVTGSAPISLDVTAGPISLFITGNASLPNKNVSLIGGDASDVYVEVHGDWQQTGSGAWNGTIFAPNGLIHIGSGSSQFTLFGHLWAHDVDIEHSVDINPEPSSMALVVIGLFGLGVRRRCRVTR